MKTFAIGVFQHYSVAPVIAFTQLWPASVISMLPELFTIVNHFAKQFVQLIQFSWFSPPSLMYIKYVIQTLFACGVLCEHDKCLTKIGWVYPQNKNIFSQNEVGLCLKQEQFYQRYVSLWIPQIYQNMWVYALSNNKCIN